MKCTVSTPFLNRIIISENGKETAMIRGLVMVDRIHYAVFIPLVTDYPIDDFMDISDESLYWESQHQEEMGELIEPLGFARIRYDYRNLKARFEFLHPYDDADEVNKIVYYMQMQML